MSTPTPDAPRCIVIAGPNGAGKTTFAREFLPHDADVLHFVNADLIAAGLSPFRPQLVALSAGRLLLRELDRLAASRADFAFEWPGLRGPTSALEGCRISHRDRVPLP
jgi:predicted ABC-type ATPase